MARSIWKGSISFGLVNIPVELHSGEIREEIGLHLLDQRDHNRIRYHRVNQETGESVPWDSIVRGYEYESGKYVILSDEELAEVKAEVTKTVEIEDFVDIQEVEPVYFDKPYYLVPQKQPRSSFKSYALLRETLRRTGKAGIARVVIRSREYLCAVMVRKRMMILNLLRFAAELRPDAEYELPADDLEALRVSPREVQMAMQLVEAMSSSWEPERYQDTYREALLAWIDEKIEKQQFEAAPGKTAATAKKAEPKVVDLMEYLKRSVEEATKERKGGDTEKIAKSRGGRRKTG